MTIFYINVFLKLFFNLQNFSVAYNIMLHFYKKISFSYNSKKIAKKLQQLFFDNFLSLVEEICYNVDLERNKKAAMHFTSFQQLFYVK